MRSLPWQLCNLLLVTAQVVQWNIERRAISLVPQLKQRAGSTLETTINNNKGKGGYFAKVEIGNPPQELTLVIDTGSSDIWVPFSKAAICEEQDNCDMGSFSPKQSGTFSTIGAGLFSISYADMSFADGDYFEDDFRINGATVTNLTMGLGLKTDIPQGVIGLGYATNEASIDTAAKVYPNLPVEMETEGLIKTVAYSLWLNDLGASKGNILFGGIDTEKYVGDLTRIPVLRDAHTTVYTHFTVALTSLEASSPSGKDTLTSQQLPIPVVLDSGTTLSYLPTDIVQQMWDEVGAVYRKDMELAVLPCSFGAHDGQFSFGFAGPNGPRINITMDELVVDLTSGQQPTFDAGPYKNELLCEFGIQNSTSSPWLLGDTFLRSAYVVYDLVNNEIGLAATDFNSTASNIIPFASKGAAIPSATVALSQGSVTAQETSGPTTFDAADGFQDTTGDNTGAGSNSKFVRASIFLPILATMMLFK